MQPSFTGSCKNLICFLININLILLSMLYILYSNDYEVFLGGNYLSETEILIDTTEKVLSACNNVGIPMTLFCDVACLWRYRKLGYSDFPDIVENQLRNAIKDGHDVQAHIHPHWFETNIEKKENGSCNYNYDLQKFLLGNWMLDDNDKFNDFIYDVFSRAKEYLEKLFTDVNSSYRCLAYRAGGYGIQPRTKKIFKALIDTGYLIDSSIVPGMLMNSNVNRIDFTHLPQKGNYYISPKYDLEKVSSEGIFEIPIIASRKARAILTKRIFNKLLQRLLGHRPTSYELAGYPIQSTNNTKPQKARYIDRICKIANSIQHGWDMLELGYDVDRMVNLTRLYVDQFDFEDHDLFFSFSCHSKSTDKISLVALESYHKKLEKIYNSKFRAITFQEAATILNLKSTKSSYSQKGK